MSLWLFNQNIPNTLYSKINNFNEYVKAIGELKKPINIKSQYSDEILDVEIFPYDGDDKLWKEEFLVDSFLDNELLTEDILKVKPNKEEYPVILIYKNSYKDFYWISLKDFK